MKRLQAPETETVGEQAAARRTRALRSVESQVATRVTKCLYPGAARVRLRRPKLPSPLQAEGAREGGSRYAAQGGALYLLPQHKSMPVFTSLLSTPATALAAIRVTPVSV